MSQSEHGDGGHGIGAVVAALVANLLIAIAKLVGAILSGSSAMLAESLHSAADSGNQALLLFGNSRSNRAPDANHPFGYGQELYFWSLIVAIILFGLGGGFSVYEGIRHIRHPAELGDPTLNYIILAFAFVVELAALWYALRALEQRHPDTPFWRAVRTSKDPRIFVPIGEDAAALAGVVVAFLGIFFAHRLEMPLLDGAASLVIGAILAGVAVFLAVETRALLIGEAMAPHRRARIEEITMSDDAVVGVNELATMFLGPEQVLLAMDVRFRSDLTMDALTEAVDRIEERIRREDPRISRIFLEAEGLTES
ncbi:MAG: cation diffusion facilitator family transporter [Gemmatimonadota bacterium]|nr:cation diffusion facilitator family transporter [Gemmatimonadota bacterium]